MLYCTIRRWYVGQGKYKADLSGIGSKPIANGSFPTVLAAKQWGKNWAKSKKTSVTFELLK